MSRQSQSVMSDDDASENDAEEDVPKVEAESEAPLSPDDTDDDDQAMVPINTALYFPDEAVAKEAKAAELHNFVRFTDTKGRQCEFLLKDGILAFSLNGRKTVAHVKQLHAVGLKLVVDGKRGMLYPASRVSLPQGQETTVVQVMELFGRRAHGLRGGPPLCVTVISARGLRNADTGITIFGGTNLSDPYCVCEIVGKPEAQFKTRAIDDNLSPVWNHMGELLGYEPGNTLHFSVFDKDLGKKDDFLGQVSLLLDGPLPSIEKELRLNDAGVGREAYITIKVTAGTRADRLKQRLVRELAEACLRKDVDLLQAAIAGAKAVGLDRSEYAESTKLLGDLLNKKYLEEEAQELLQEALKSAEETALKEAIAAAKAAGFDKSEYQKATDLLSALWAKKRSEDQARSLLKDACDACDVDAIHAAIAAAKAAKLDPSEYKLAEELLQEEARKQHAKKVAREALAKLHDGSSMEALIAAIEAAKAAGLEQSEYAEAADFLHRLKVAAELERSLKEARSVDRRSLEAMRAARDALQAVIHEARRLSYKDEDLMEAELLRKSIHNSMEDLKGAIRVFCRIRPMSKTEEEAGYQNVTTKLDLTTVQVCQAGVDYLGETKMKQHDFHFDAVFLPGTQEEVFADCKELVQSALDGYNITLFAYGQTGAGKTFTMTGTPDNVGIAQRTVSEIFDVMQKNSALFDYSVSASVLELYRNKAIDLLAKQEAASADPSAPISLTPINIRYDEKLGTFVMDSLTHRDCHSAEDLFGVLDDGMKHRVVAETAMNTDSSRSHLVCIIRLTSTNKTSEEKIQGKIVIVDLAGSERLKKSLSTGDREKEAIEINKSLTALGDVIEALTTKQKIIPYRNHKLTEILQDSLGGSAKTLMFVNCSPSSSNCEETLTSLRYATRAKNVINNPEGGKNVGSPGSRKTVSRTTQRNPPASADSPSPSSRQRASMQESPGDLKSLPELEKLIFGEEQTGGLLPRVEALEKVTVRGETSGSLHERLAVIQRSVGNFDPPSRVG
mmetsp:Transcript_100635/g.178681  ORF Transcript_100635/g.178681 Transcript_100635/m.178681 type:complete len:1014 (+) Transcript_100635:59-3100(+)